MPKLREPFSTGTNRLRDMSGDGYSSQGRPNYDHKLTVRFDLSEYKRDYAEFLRSISDLNSKAAQMTKNLKSTNKGYGVYIQANQVKPFIGDDVISRIIPNAKELSPKLQPLLTEIGKLGKETMLKYATRKETGDMRSDIRYMQERSGNQAVVHIGWVRRWRKYYSYQESGTRTVKPMHSILRTRLEIEPKVQKMYDAFLRKYDI